MISAVILKTEMLKLTVLGRDKTKSKCFMTHFGIHNNKEKV